MKRIIFVLIALTLSQSSYSQFKEKSEVGIIIGGGNYIGDINPKYNFYNTNFMLGGIYRYNFNPRWVLRAGASFSKLGAYDSDSENNIRNLSFKSNITELSLICEFNFFDYQTGSRKHRITPYLYGGLGVFFMNPKTEIFNPLTQRREWVELQPLSTEGQGMEGYDSPYSLTQISIPFGLGVKFSLNSYICIGLDWGLRLTFTDYIDDVSKNYVDRDDLTLFSNELSAAASDRSNEIINGYYNNAGEMRGNPQKNDLYQFFGLTITSKIDFFRNRIKCDKF